MNIPINNFSSIQRQIKFSVHCITDHVMDTYSNKSTDIMYNAFNVCCRELAPGTVTGPRATTVNIALTV